MNHSWNEAFVDKEVDGLPRKLLSGLLCGSSLVMCIFYAYFCQVSGQETEITPTILSRKWFNRVKEEHIDTIERTEANFILSFRRDFQKACNCPPREQLVLSLSKGQESKKPMLGQFSPRKLHYSCCPERASTSIAVVSQHAWCPWLDARSQLQKKLNMSTIILPRRLPRSLVRHHLPYLFALVLVEYIQLLNPNLYSEGPQGTQVSNLCGIGEHSRKIREWILRVNGPHSTQMQELDFEI